MISAGYGGRISARVGERVLVMQKRSFLVNKYDLLFILCALVFFFSENVTGISLVDSLFALLEKYKIKYFLALAVCTLFLLRHWGNNRFFRTEFYAYIRNLILLAVISVTFGVTRGIPADILNEVLYLLVPIVFSYALINVKGGQVKSCLEQFFWIILIGFILINRRNFSIASILSINFMESYSPFESGISYVSLLMALYYKWENNKPKLVVCVIMGVLSFKRLALVCMILVLILPIRKVKGSHNLKLAQNITIAIFCLIPLFLQAVFSEGLEQHISNFIGMDINAFMKGRFTALQIAFENYPPAGGLGSLRKFLTNSYSWITYTEKNRSMDLHCDIVRFYLECTILGLFSLLHTYIKNAKTWKTFLAVTLVLTLSLTTHLFGYGAVLYWIYYYTLFFYLNNSDEEKTALQA